MRQLAVLSLLLAMPVAADEPPPPIALLHVNLVDVRAGTIVRDTTVVVTGDQISAIGKRPVDARTLDATGKYLIPGLWDMHIHHWDERFLAMFIVNGVTGVRLMSGEPQHFRWREAIRAGRLVGPRLVIASPALDGPGAYWPGSFIVAAPEDAAAAVQKVVDGKFDLVKIYDRLSPASYRAVMAEAKRRGLVAAGHVPDAVDAGEASDLGQRSIEHSTGILMASSREAPALQARFVAVRQGVTLDAPADAARRTQIREVNERILATFDAGRALALFRRFAKNRTFLVPTLCTDRGLSRLDDPAFRADPRVKYFAPETSEWWDPVNDYIFKHLVPADYEQARRIAKKKLELVAEAHRAGVRILAGTDSPQPFCFPGFGLQDELELLVQAGLSPLDALRAATLYPAEYFGQPAGAVEVGKPADLVLLDGNPLENIGNVRRVVAVVAAGRLFERHDLAKILAEAERLGRQKAITPRLQAILDKQGIPAAVAFYREARRTPEQWDLREAQMNVLGYGLLKKKRVKEAVAIFELIVETHPGSWNAHDSLGEALAADGQAAASIASYKKSLELNPANDNARKRLEKR